jgi:hypothetical protein
MQEQVSVEDAVITMHNDGYRINLYDTDEVQEDLDDEVFANCLCAFNLVLDPSN